MKNEKKLVIMMSGGLDSYLAYRWAKEQRRDVLPIWVDLGQPYRKKELTAIRALGVPVREITCGILNQKWGNMPTPDQQIIRARNGLLAMIGALYGQEVWIVALEGEMHPYMLDKNPAFFTAAGNFFSQIIGEEITVTTPFADKSKAGIIRWALSAGVTPEEMSRTVTCYDPIKKACGKCSSCFKRWVAMTINGIDEPYRNPPIESAFASEYVPKITEAIISGNHEHYSKNRCAETLAAVHLDFFA